MTAHAMKGDEARCLAAGMDGYLSKPIQPDEFFDVIERHLNVSSPHASPPAAGIVASPRTTPDLAKGDSLVHRSKRHAQPRAHPGDGR